MKTTGKHLSNQKTSSSASREQPGSSSSKSKTKEPTYTQVSIQSANASNSMKHQNLNNNMSSKSIQPILRQKDELASNPKFSPSQQNALKKSNSGPMDKKVKQGTTSPINSNGQSSNPKTMKESTFNYQEQTSKQEMQSDGTPNRQLFKKAQPNTNSGIVNKGSSQKKISQIQAYDDQFIEVVQVDQDQDFQNQQSKSDNKQNYKNLKKAPSDLEDLKNRPSDEVQYQELLMEEKDQSSSLGSSIVKSSQGGGYQVYQSNSKFSPEIVGNNNNDEYYQRNNTDTKLIGINQFKRGESQQYQNIQHMKIDESGFKVHQESSRGAESVEDRLLQIEGIDKVILAQNNDLADTTNINLAYSENDGAYNGGGDYGYFDNTNSRDANQIITTTENGIHNKNNKLEDSNMMQRNSDFKRFNMDEELQNQQALRVAKQTQEVSKERNILINYNNNNNNDQYNQQDIIIQNDPSNRIFNNFSNDSQYFSNIDPRNMNQQEVNLDQVLFNQNIPISPSSFGSPQISLQIDKNIDKQQQQQQQPSLRQNILSFADKNQLYLEYPPMQMNNNNNSNLPSQPLSPTAIKQQQRLQDILQTSKGGDVQQLNHALQSQKIDEQQLNSMIDMEKNYVIMQYESILQQLNIEFHKLLAKNKETEDGIHQKETLIKTQALMIQDKDEQLFSQDQLCRNLKNQVQDLLADIDFTQNKVHTQRTVASEIETYRLERELQDQKIQSLSNQIRQYQSVEIDLREQLDSVQSRLRHVDLQLRNKEEEAYQSDRDKQKLLKDLKNMGDIEIQLKEEIKGSGIVRMKLEDQLQEEKQRSFQNEVGKRQREMELENVIRDNRGLKGSLDILQSNYSEISNENCLLKEAITENERHKILAQSQLDKQEREVKRLQGEARKNQLLLEQAQSQIQSYAFQEESRQGETLRKQVTQSYQYNTAYQDQQQQNDKQSYQQQLEYQQKPFKEHNTNSFYSPQRNNLRNQPQQLQFNQSPPMVQPNGGDGQTKNNIVWLSQGGVNSNSSNSTQQNSDQQYQSRQQQRLEDDKNGSGVVGARRKTYMNQNESQLNEFFQWPGAIAQKGVGNNGSPQGVVGGLTRSLERDRGRQNNTQQQQNVQVQENNWTKGKSPLAQYMNPSTSAQQLLPQQQQYAQYMQKPKVQQQQQQLQSQQEDQDMPAAGKKSTIQMGQSPLHNKGNKNSEQQTAHLQNSLSALQMDKEMLDNEFRRLGTHPKNKQQIDKKQQVEFELDILNKNIGNIKQKLRELNAF